MSDIETENYWKSVEKIIGIWGDEAKRIGDELKKVQKDLADLEANKTPGPDDKKKIEQLKERCRKLHQEMDDASASLDLNLNVIKPVPKADEDEFKKIPELVKKIIKAKGIPLGKVVITPDIKIDFKARKLKSIGITIKW